MLSRWNSSRRNWSRRNWSRRNGSRRNRSRRTRMLPKIQCSVQVDTMDPSLSNSTPMDPLNATDSSPYGVRIVYQA